MKVLVIVTSHEKFGGAGKTTGLWFDELATPFVILSDEDHELTLASISGGRIPIEPRSHGNMAQSEYTRAFRSNADALCLLSNTPKIASVSYKTFDAILLVGGYGALWDFPNNQKLQEIILYFYQEGRIIATLSQGAAGLIHVKDEKGQPITHGHTIAATKHSEDESQGVTKILPLSLEQALIDSGADFVGGKDWQPHIVTDLPFISGQNFSSAISLAHEMLRQLN